VALRDRAGALRGYGELCYDLTVRDEAESQSRLALLRALDEPAARLLDSVSEVLALSKKQSSGAYEHAAAGHDTHVTGDQLTRTSEQSAESARTVAEASQRALEVSGTGRTAVEDAVVSMATVKDQVEAIAESVLGLAEQAQAIAEIIATVNEIAEQTNLL